MKNPVSGRTESGLEHPVVWVGVLAFTLATLYAAYVIWWISIPVVCSIVLYYLCVPFLDLMKRRGITNDQGLMVLLCGATVLALLGGLVFLPLAYVKIEQMRDQMPQYLGQFQDLMDRTLKQMETQFPWLAGANFAQEAAARIALLKTKLIEEHLSGVVVHLLTWIVSVLLIPYLTFFMLKDGGSFKRLVMRGVPNAFFEKILLLFERMDAQVKQYFRGLMAMTFLDTVTLGTGLWLLGLPHGMFPFGQAYMLGLVAAVFSWVPYVGSIVGCLLILGVALVFAPGNLALASGALLLFVFVRLLDDFIYTPMTIGRSLSVHPLVTVVVLFCGGMIGGIPGLLLAMPALGVAMVLGDIFGQVWFDPRLRARHTHARALRQTEARLGLGD
ncbi:MAG: AI-2E family transporter [Candidatus Methylacidiphilales bacterium]|nr:AI-2E family transporter [Candidatus Methylacidiphilales bacterium]